MDGESTSNFSLAAGLAGIPRDDNPYFLAAGFHTAASAPQTQAFPSSILLIEDCPHRILSSATVVFFDSNGQQFITVEDIYVSRHAHGHPLISPVDYTRVTSSLAPWRT
jgi:hypothetical protein